MKGKRSAQAAELPEAGGIKAAWPRLVETRGHAREPDGGTPTRNRVLGELARAAPSEIGAMVDFVSLEKRIHHSRCTRETQDLTTDQDGSTDCLS